MNTSLTEIEQIARHHITERTRQSGRVPQDAGERIVRRTTRWRRPQIGVR